MKIYFLDKQDDEHESVSFYAFRDYLQRLIEYHHIEVEFVDTISRDTVSNSFYFRFTPSIKDEWFAYYDRIVCMFHWYNKRNFAQYGLAARTMGNGIDAYFWHPKIIGFQKVAIYAGLKHSHEIHRMPYCSIMDFRFQNKCDLLVAYLDVYNEMAKNGELPILKI